MGLITDRLGVVAKYVGDNKNMVDQLEFAGEAIEAELKKLSETVGKEVTRLNQKIDELATTVGKELRGQDKRIETLEKQIKHTEDKFDLLLKEHLRPLEILEPLPYDKNGKPEGGLEKGDVLTAESKAVSKWIGRYHKSSDGGEHIWGNWKQGGEGLYLDQKLFWIERKYVTFEFRPQKPKEDC